MFLERRLQLPHPSISYWDSQLFARCREVDAGLFYEDDSTSEMMAKLLCDSCPVLAECRAYAIMTNEPHGIRAGLMHG